MDKKEDPTKCCPLDTQFTFKDTNNFSGKGWKSIFHTKKPKEQDSYTSIRGNKAEITNGHKRQIRSSYNDK